MWSDPSPSSLGGPTRAGAGPCFEVYDDLEVDPLLGLVKPGEATLEPPAPDEAVAESGSIHDPVRFRRPPISEGPPEQAPSQLGWSSWSSQSSWERKPPRRYLPSRCPQASLAGLESQELQVLQSKHVSQLSQVLH